MNITTALLFPPACVSCSKPRTCCGDTSTTRSPSAALSRSVGVSERTLRNAFADVHRESPKRYFLNERLRRAQQALTDVRCAGTTVTAVATQYGFYELGRFALQYKAMFGESPSHTLRRHRPSTRLQHAG